ncbi:hypothetical protein Aglo01_48130 [Actinokineospora globicatena]|nr:hypothetical protein Aglo01_48130 [Actinokineospora globicatena]GLW87160.1 hypothetical protein Aglo02_47990 [Actinokineospora globicatena]
MRTVPYRDPGWRPLCLRDNEFRQPQRRTNRRRTHQGDRLVQQPQSTGRQLSVSANQASKHGRERVEVAQEVCLSVPSGVTVDLDLQRPLRAVDRERQVFRGTSSQVLHRRVDPAEVQLRAVRLQVHPRSDQPPPGCEQVRFPPQVLAPVGLMGTYRAQLCPYRGEQVPH